MYAAILSSIETREYSWKSNFDRFESILYRKVLADRGVEHKEHRNQEGRKRFCRDYNEPEGCPKSSPHSVWFGSGPSATRKMVYHCCVQHALSETRWPEITQKGMPIAPIKLDKHQLLGSTGGTTLMNSQHSYHQHSKASRTREHKMQKWEHRTETR